MEIAVFSLGEGKIVEKLLSELSGDGTFKRCIRIIDRPLAVSDWKLTLFVPKLDKLLKELINNLASLTEIEIYSRDCGDIKNCIQVKGFYPLEALKEFLRHNGETDSASLIENFNPSVQESEIFDLLKEKLGIYIPLMVSKRKSISYGWKYYLSLNGIPSISFLYPAERQNILNTLSSTGFRDKLIPIFIGTFEETFLSEVKQRGYVPCNVKPTTNRRLLMELELIYTAKVISEQVFKP